MGYDYDDNEIALGNIRRILVDWTSPEQSLIARLKIDAELKSVNK